METPKWWIDMSWNLPSQSIEIIQNLNDSIYSVDYKAFSVETWIGTIDHHGAYVFADETHAKQIYADLQIPLIECADGKAITTYCKQFLQQYCNKYPELWKLDDWSCIADQYYSQKIQLWAIMHDRSSVRKIPYLWYLKIKSSGDYERTHTSKTISLWLPLMMNWKLIHMRCSPGAPTTSFDNKDSRACPIGIFDTRSDLSK